MGRAAKKRRHDKRKEMKAKRKEAKRLLYKSYAEKGRESRQRKHGKRTEGSGKKGQHVMADCGNVGCVRCYPKLNDYVLCNGWRRSAWHKELQERKLNGNCV